MSTTADILAAFGWADLVALALLVLGWLGIGWWIEHPRARRPSVSVLMAGYRHQWTAQMRHRSQRVFDAAILQNLREGTAFFASTCLLAIGGVMALIMNPGQLEQAAGWLPLLHVSPAVWQIKLLPVLLLLTSGFLKFVWSNRLFGYFSVLIGAMPNEAQDPRTDLRAWQAGEVNVRAAANFNRGLRAIYFALAGLAWLAGPWALMGASAVTMIMLWTREFRSVSRAVLERAAPEVPPPPGG